MKRFAAIAAALALMIGICPAYAADSITKDDISGLIRIEDEQRQVLLNESLDAESINMDILSSESGNYGIMLASEDEDSLQAPCASSVEKATLTGTVEGGEIIENDHISFDNGGSASVYTVTLSSGSYAIDGFSAECKYNGESMTKDFTIPEISDTYITINIVVNRPEADITISALKSNGEDAFFGSGVPIVNGRAEDWKLNDDGYTIEEYIGPEVDELVIPNMIDGNKILIVQNTTLINNGKIGTLFGECTQSIDADGNYIYSVDEKAKSIKLSEGILAVGSYAFFACDGLTGEINIPSSVRVIGWDAFYECSGLTGGLDLSGCTSLNPFAFAGCTGLNGKLILSDKITSIPRFAFYGCPLSGEINIPKSVTDIGKAAFYGCSGLTGDLDLSGCNTLDEYAFAYCSGLKGELTLSDKLTSVPNGAFWESAFSGTLEIPDGVTDIGEAAFGLNGTKAGFTSLKLPSTLKTIGAVAFQNQSNLGGELTLPEGLTHIGDFAFDHCYSFTNTALTIPSTVTTIGGDNGIAENNNNENTGYGGHVFYDAFPKSTEFIVGEGSESFKTIDGVLYSKDGTRLVAYPEGKADASYVLPDETVQIDEMALGKSKIEELTLPDGFEITKEIPVNIINQDGNNLAVGFYSDNSCKNVRVYETNESYISEDGMIYSADGTVLWYVPVKHEGVTVKDGCTTIMDGAFYGKSGINKWTDIYIPASVTLIESSALRFINGSGANITVSEDNTSYKVNAKGKLEAIKN